MSIAPPVGAMSAYLSRLVSSQPLSVAPPPRQARSPSISRSRCETAARAGRGVRPRPGHRRHAVRGAGLLLRRPDRRPQPRPPAPGAGERARRARTRAGAGPRRDPEGQGLRRRPRQPPTSITASPSSTSSPARRPRPKANAPTYTTVFAEALIKEAETDDTIVAITAAMPSGTGLDLFAKRFPDALLRRRHRRAARGDLRRRPRRPRACKPFCAIYSTFLQRAYDQVVHDVAIQKPAGALRDRPRRAGRRRRRRPMPARSTSPISAACRAS